MYASVHSDRSARVLISNDHGAAGLGGVEAVPVEEAIPLPEGSRLVPLARDALAFGHSGRIRALGPGRLALAALLPPGYLRLLVPAYRDDPSRAALDALPYVALAAGPGGEPLVAAAAIGDPAAVIARRAPGGAADALRRHPANALARQLARCAHDHACVEAAGGVGHGDLPAPLGAPPAERPRLPLALRSGYAGAPAERAAFRPSAAEIAELAVDHAEHGGTGISFGRACDGEPLLRIRVLEDAVAEVRSRVPSFAAHLETAGSDPAALRRALDAGITSLTVRIGSALPETYATLHGPVGHRWSDVRASFQVAAERGVPLTIAVLVLPGLSDRPAEIDALVALLGELPGGRLELRDLGCDPLRTLAAFPRAPALGVRALLGRLRATDHFRLGTSREPALAEARR